MALLKTDKVRREMGAAIAEILLLHLPPVSPDSTSRARMLDNILQNVRQDQGRKLCTVRSNEGEWIEIMPGIHRKQLYRNQKMHASLYRMAAGSSFPAHDHASDEESVCLEGEVSLGGTTIRAGDFHFAPQGLRHEQIHSLQGCLLYIRCAA